MTIVEYRVSIALKWYSRGIFHRLGSNTINLERPSFDLRNGLDLVLGASPQHTSNWSLSLEPKSLRSGPGSQHLAPPIDVPNATKQLLSHYRIPEKSWNIYRDFHQPSLEGGNQGKLTKQIGSQPYSTLFRPAARVQTTKPCVFIRERSNNFPEKNIRMQWFQHLLYSYLFQTISPC